MRTLSTFVSAALLCAAVPCFGLTHTRHASSTHANIRHSTVKVRHGHASVRHETIAMNSERATQIQSALIKSGYLSGEPSGNWDSETAAAMQKLQGDNGWQTKITPDSRALIKLGLGPQRDYQTASNALPQ
ncbi:MAG TPA: peptidoglycan-binding domain-containing protein [Acidobacteriaceae bacterium]